MLVGSRSSIQINAALTVPIAKFGAVRDEIGCILARTDPDAPPSSSDAIPLLPAVVELPEARRSRAIGSGSSSRRQPLASSVDLGEALEAGVCFTVSNSQARTPAVTISGAKDRLTSRSRPSPTASSQNKEEKHVHANMAVAELMLR